MNTLARRIAAVNARLALLDRMSADALEEAQQLAAYKTALEMAHMERTSLPFDIDDEIDPADERRAQEILKLYPQEGAVP